MALVAGADQLTAVRLGLAMVGLQMSIGALNDLVDAAADTGRTPPKPIPTGLVSVRVARIVVAVAAGVGLLLAVPSGPVVIALAVVGLAIGYGYDLLAKGTAWSWLPFALGIPLLPVFGWVGATGHLPDTVALLVPLAMAAGTALAIANARADMERDAVAGVQSVASWLGPHRAWVVEATLLTLVALVALGSLWLRAASQPALVGTAVAAVVISSGFMLGRRGSPARRQVAWEIEAVGLALLAAAWLAGTADQR